MRDIDSYVEAYYRRVQDRLDQRYCRFCGEKVPDNVRIPDDDDTICERCYDIKEDFKLYISSLSAKERDIMSEAMYEV